MIQDTFSYFKFLFFDFPFNVTIKMLQTGPAQTDFNDSLKLKVQETKVRHDNQSRRDVSVSEGCLMFKR